MRFLTNLGQKLVQTCSEYRGEPTSLLWTITPSILKSANTSTTPDKEDESNVCKTWNPQTSFSDNGPKFTLLEFRKFSANWDFGHDTSSPEFAWSNGMVERTIQTVKNA